jgi:multidrug transporter EmrE-like cation transporter
MSTYGFLLMILDAVCSVSANLMLRAGIKRGGGFPGTLPEIPRALLKLSLEPLFVLGMSTYALAALIWFRIVATQPLSVGYPLVVSITLTLVTLGSVVLFREPISAMKVVGLLCIIAGIVLISRTQQTII